MSVILNFVLYFLVCLGVYLGSYFVYYIEVIYLLWLVIYVVS